MPSVLVVDDQDQVRQLIRETLEQACYEAEEACDGKERLERYRTRSVDLNDALTGVSRFPCDCHDGRI